MTDESRNDSMDANADPTDTSADSDGGRTDSDDRGERTSSADPGESDDRERTASKLTRYLNYAVLAGLLLLAFVAALQFYLSAQSAIDVWIAREYRAPFRAAFNLAVLLLTGLGISYQLRRLTGGSDRVESE